MWSVHQFLRHHIQPVSPTTEFTNYTGFQSVVPKSSTGGFSLKVVQAEISSILGKGHPNYEMIGQMFTTVCERTSNVAYILTQIQREFGQEYVVITADGLEEKNLSGTQGMSENTHAMLVCMSERNNRQFNCGIYIGVHVRLTAHSLVGLKFWRVNSRKFYAVLEEDLLAPYRKKFRSVVQAVDLTDDCTEAVRDLAHSVDLLTKKVNRISKLTKDTAIPLGLCNLRDDHLRGKICHASPMTLPIIIVKCCCSIISHPIYERFAKLLPTEAPHQQIRLIEQICLRVFLTMFSHTCFCPLML